MDTSQEAGPSVTQDASDAAQATMEIRVKTLAPAVHELTVPSTVSTHALITDDCSMSAQKALYNVFGHAVHRWRAQRQARTARRVPS